MDFEIQKINYKDKLFPKSLKNIKEAPKELYFSGRLENEENRVAIVGARNCSKYGEDCCLKIGADLAEAGIIIVSGLARGIDSAAHTAAVRSGKRTIAVLGTAIDDIYPKENIKLAEQIIKNNGLILSEYAPGTVTYGYDFARRNRLIAGLSLGVLVVEAKEKSGSLITAEYAREQGKKLFAVPGSIYSQNSRGCHKLIKNGAVLVENANDVLKELKLKNLPLTYKNGKELIKGNSPAETAILNALAETQLNIENIIKTTNLPPEKAMATVSLLEIQNKIIDLGENTYCLNRN
ncbi:MAG: DNA-processing protein DprA [Candidatus Paceibacterota bacterium]